MKVLQKGDNVYGYYKLSPFDIENFLLILPFYFELDVEYNDS